MIKKCRVQSEKRKTVECILLQGVLLIFTLLALRFSLCFADTLYLANNTTEKGLVVEEQYDRFILSAEDGEKQILKSAIDEIFFDEPYQNNFYLGKKFEREGAFESALRFYRLALQGNPDFWEASDAIKGLEDAKWRFKKSWRYSELREAMDAQLGVVLKDVNGAITVGSIDRGSASAEGLLRLDVLISSWEEPLTHAGLKNASRLLIGLSNTVVKVIIERHILMGAMPGLSIKPFSPLAIGMEPGGITIRMVKKGSLPYAAGLREGDIIVKIDSNPTRYMKLAEATKKIFNSKEKRLTVRRGVVLMRKRSEANNAKRAMWVWDSKEILSDGAKRKELFDFCAAKNIGTLFFQLQYEFVPSGDEKSCRILGEDELRVFLSQAHAAKIAVYYLDGAAEFCLEDAHPLVLSQLKAVIEFNKKGAPHERFDGAHYDNEPYLLPEFGLPQKRDGIISQFTALNEKCARLIKESGVKLAFGIDIPFWFDSLNRLDARLIDICDNVGIMDYRNFASGPDGIIQHAMDEIKYADSAGKKVFIGVETSKYPPSEVYFIAALGQEQAGRLTRLNKFEGFSVKAYSYDNVIYLGLVKPAAADEKGFKEALLRFSGVASAIAKPENKEASDSLMFDLTAAIAKNPEFLNAEAGEYILADGKACLLVKADEVMLEKLTFADSTEKDMEEALAQAWAEFKKHPSFAGFAIHHYKSYRELCEKK